MGNRTGLASHARPDAGRRPMLMYENSLDEDEFSKRLQELYGVGPKTAEIFMRETEELFARRAE
jgi:3-methyladenine DNA glycosylase/8-oxoguanine DNA glycosylase